MDKTKDITTVMSKLFSKRKSFGLAVRFFNKGQMTEDLAEVYLETEFFPYG
jgi:hypothetical protein